MVEKLSKLVNVEPRDIWANEASNFTPWLRDHIELLSQAVGIEIQDVQAEVSVGDFAVDLVGEETGKSRPVIIENQLERTNHTHLGQILTYAAGKDGGVIIWVSPEIRPEHRRALEWLNEATRGNLDFFGVELEVLQIEGSELRAPNFKVIVGPGSVANKRSSTPLAGDNPSELQIRYQSFFQSLLEAIREADRSFTNRNKATNRSWMSFSAGRAGFGYALAFTATGRFRIELYIDLGDRDQNKKAFDSLEKTRREIEKELGADLDWDRLDNRRACRISRYYVQGITIWDSEEKLVELRNWIVQPLFHIRRVMLPYIQSLDLSSEDELHNDVQDDLATT